MNPQKGRELIESLSATGQLVKAPAVTKGDRRPLVMQVG
jgi:hypothetical protein